jgi:hypothetical protein
MTVSDQRLHHPRPGHDAVIPANIFQPLIDI